MKLRTIMLSTTGGITAALMAFSAQAATATLVDNAVIVDNAPFYTIDGGDGLGAGNYALNHPSFIDIPYAIFDFGGASSVSSASLSLDYLGPYENASPASITLYAGSDADGSVSVLDRFMGSAIDTYSYLAPESRVIDITAIVNSVLALGDSFAIRLEVADAPGTLTGYLGGQFATPVVTYEQGPGPSAVPLPAGLPLLGGALVMVGAARRRKTRRA